MEALSSRAGRHPATIAGNGGLPALTNADQPVPRDLPDCSIRESLHHPDNLRAFLRRAVPAWADGFACEHARLLSREFPLADWRGREADLPFEIPYRLGPESGLALVFLLLEHQSDTDPLMPLRLLYFLNDRARFGIRQA